MTEYSVSVLLVEDMKDDADLLRTMLEGGGTAFHVRHVDSLGGALQRLRGEHYDVMLLDLSLPDSAGLQALFKVREHTPDVPVIVITGLDDEQLAVSSLQEGAQDYLVKGQVSSSFLARSIRYTIERHRLLSAVEWRLQWEQQEREFRSLVDPPAREGFPWQGDSGQLLSERLPDAFDDISDQYGKLLDLALEKRLYRTKHDIAGRLAQVADRLGRVNAGPWDMVEIHSKVLNPRIQESSSEETPVYIEEGRLRLLQLMGYMVQFYRSPGPENPE